jgi:hypothetical protein
MQRQQARSPYALGMARRMAQLEFRQEQIEGVHDPRVATVNDYCDLLATRANLQVPYIPPHYDTRDASIVVMSSNPGPKAGGDNGSGFLSIENDDPSAERMAGIFEAVDLTTAQAFPWNAYPWHVHESYPNGLTNTLITDGIPALVGLLELHPVVTAIIAHGGDAHRSAALLQRTHADLLSNRGIRVFAARHTGNRSFALAPEDREVALAAMRETYREAMRYARLTPIEDPEDARRAVNAVRVSSMTKSEAEEYVAALSPADRDTQLVHLLSARGRVT